MSSPIEAIFELPFPNSVVNTHAIKHPAAATFGRGDGSTTQKEHADASQQFANVTELLRSLIAFLNSDHAINVNILQYGHTAFTLA